MNHIAKVSEVVIVWIWSYIWPALNLIFKDSIRGFLYFAQASPSNYKEDAETKEIIRKFYIEYLEKGWSLIMSCIRTVMLLIYFYALIFIKQTDQYYKLTVVEWPILFGVMVILDTLFQKFINIREIILMIMIFFLDLQWFIEIIEELLFLFMKIG